MLRFHLLCLLLWQHKLRKGTNIYFFRLWNTLLMLSWCRGFVERTEIQSAKIPERTLNGHFCHFTDNSLLYSSRFCRPAVILHQHTSFTNVAQLSLLQQRFTDKKMLDYHPDRASCGNLFMEMEIWFENTGMCAFASANTYPSDWRASTRASINQFLKW